MPLNFQRHNVFMKFRAMKTLLKNLLIAALTMPLLSSSCKKQGQDLIPVPPGPDSIIPQVDPPLAQTVGFFMHDWQERKFTAPASFNDLTAPTTSSVTVNIDRSKVITKIPRSFAGNNANIWMGDMVNETKLLNYLTDLHPHIIRFPGGSISDIYFWNENKDQPPADAPAKLIKADGSSTDAGYWYGKNNESWTISLDKYYSVLQKTGNQGMIIINYGYARYGTGTNPVARAAHLAADWVRYDNGRTKYWEIGNENYGDWEAGYRINTAENKDNQPEILTGQLYGQHFKVFADSMRQAAKEIGKTIYIGAVSYESVPQGWNTNTVKTWNTGMYPAAGNSPDFYIIHNYYTAYQTNANANEILNTPEPVTKSMVDLVRQAVTTAGLQQKPVALTEFNIFSQGSMQSVSHVNGMHAVMVLGEALKNKIGMTARWDLANGWDSGNDHGMFNNGDEPGAIKWNARPAFYHMYFFSTYLGDRLLESSTSSPGDLKSYASSFSTGETAVALVNQSADTRTAEIKVKNFKKGKRYYWYTLTGSNDNGEFSRKVIINNQGPSGVSGGPDNYKTIQPHSAVITDGVRVTVPGRSTVVMVIEGVK